MSEESPDRLRAPLPRSLVGPHPPRLDTWRCPTCNRILAKLRLAPGSVVQIKCSICNTMATREPA